MRHPPIFFCWKSIFFIYSFQVKVRRWPLDGLQSGLGCVPLFFDGLDWNVRWTWAGRQSHPWLCECECVTLKEMPLMTMQCARKKGAHVKKFSIVQCSGRVWVEWEEKQIFLGTSSSRFITYQDPIRPGPRPHFTLNLKSGSHILHLNYTSHSCLIYWLWAPYLERKVKKIVFFFNRK